MKINVRILLITLTIVVLVSASSTYLFYSSTKKILQTKQRTQLLNSASNFMFTFQLELEKVKEDYSDLKPNILNSEPDLKATGIDYLIITDTNDEIVKSYTKSFSLLLQNISTFDEFSKQNLNIVNANDRVGKFIIHYGINLTEKKLSEISKRVNSEVAVVLSNQVIETSNSSQNHSYYFQILESVKELKGSKNFKIRVVNLDEIDFWSVYYSPRELEPFISNLNFLIFLPSKQGVEFRDILRQILVIIIIAGGLLSLVLVLFFTTKLRKQISYLSETTRNVMAGDLDQRVEIMSNDEIGMLGLGFNKMLDEIGNREKIQQQHLEFITLINQNASLENISEASLSKIIDATKVRFGALYLVENEKLRTLSNLGLTGYDSSENNFDYVSVLKNKEIIELEFKENYPVIKTGLTEFKIVYMMLAPVLFNNEVIAIVELVNDTIPYINIKEYLNHVLSELGVGLTNSLAFEKLERLVEDLKSLNATYEKQNFEIKNKNTQLVELHEELKTKANELEKQKEKALELSKVKSQFLASISHELRTPLNSILGLTELVIKDNSTLNKTRDRLDIVLRNGKKLLTLITNILEFSRLESGKIEVKSEGFFINDFILNLHQFMEPLAVEKGLELNVKIENNEDLYVHTDTSKLEQVLINLISNAIKFTEVGKVSLLVKNVNEYDLQINIVDSGVGISKENIDLIFEEFRQVDGSIAREYGGTGLGLAICKKYVFLLGGTIEVNSTINDGSNFKIFIPNIVEYSIPLPEKKEIDIEKVETIEKQKVLIVSNENKEGEFIGNYLESNNIEVIHSGSSEDSKKIITEMKPNVILSDLFFDDKMSGLSYIELLDDDHRYCENNIFFTSVINDSLLRLSFGMFKIISNKAKSTEIISLILKYEYYLSTKFNNIKFISKSDQSNNYIDAIIKSGKNVDMVTPEEAIVEASSKKICLTIMEIEKSELNTFKKLKSNGFINSPFIFIANENSINDKDINGILRELVLEEKKNPIDLLKQIKTELDIETKAEFEENLIIENDSENNSINVNQIFPNKGLKVLIVDDDHDTLYTVGEMVDDLGCNTSFARNGIECLNKLKKIQPDIILLDIMMPKMDGFETIKRIRATMKYKNVPVIALTAHAMLDDKNVIEKNGFNGIVTKPINTGTLAFNIQKALKWN